MRPTLLRFLLQITLVWMSLYLGIPVTNMFQRLTLLATTKPEMASLMFSSWGFRSTTCPTRQRSTSPTATTFRTLHEWQERPPALKRPRSGKAEARSRRLLGRRRRKRPPKRRNRRSRNLGKGRQRRRRRRRVKRRRLTSRFTRWLEKRFPLNRLSSSQALSITLIYLSLLSFSLFLSPTKKHYDLSILVTFIATFDFLNSFTYWSFSGFGT